VQSGKAANKAADSFQSNIAASRRASWAFAADQTLVLHPSKQAQQPRASLSLMQPHTLLVYKSRCGAIAAHPKARPLL
jgi:hypothetical protein